jgi:hypothetical protein
MNGRPAGIRNSEVACVSKLHVLKSYRECGSESPNILNFARRNRVISYAPVILSNLFSVNLNS